ncbi:hypothetical protein F4811DRAFT_3740 [Daldinia bambusicola]|nr:hypothetical protein F4811DRAFT_3740 [Daldinia bambusicola]
MSAIAANAAVRTPLSALARQAFKSFRQSARIVEGPTEALPAAMPSQRADWGRIARARVGVAAVYFPALGGFLSWPFIAKAFLDGHL